MSDDPFSPYQSPSTPQEQPQPPSPSLATRPTSVTVFGILNLVFAGMGLLGLCCGLISMIGMDLIPNQQPNPVLDIMNENEAYRIFSMVSMALGFVSTVALGLAGFGLLKMRPWGRQLSLVYAVYTIIAAIVTIIATWYWLFGPLMEAADKAPPGPERFSTLISAYGSVGSNCFSFIYPIFLLIFMMRSSFVEAFRKQQGSNVPSH